METTNMTSSFIILGFSDFDYNRIALLSIILVVYALTWISNLLLLSAIKCSPQLHTPMYFFLGNLSVLDISFSTVTVPKLLSSILHGATSISFLGCFFQMYFFVSLGVSEIFLLAVMAFDRYLAICNPLRYTSVMNKKVLVMLTVGCWVTASLHSLLHNVTISRLKFCNTRLIHHFFCDMTALIKLSCSSTALAELLIYTEGSTAIIVPFLLIILSYVLIARAIMKLKTTASRSKAFSSCTSHLMVISLFYLTIIFIYFRSPSNYSPQYDRIVSIAYAVVTPMLNPFIYSLRNQDVKQALKKIFMQFYSQSRYIAITAVTGRGKEGRHQQFLSQKLPSQLHYFPPSFQFSMEGNMTIGFILLGFSDLPLNGFALFSVILVVYILTWMGNSLLLLSICLSRKLHTPMYFFLGNLSAMDIFLSSVSVPKLLSGFLHGAEPISFVGCLLQMYFFLALGVSELLLLAVMAFDRCSAICNPLRYRSVINKKNQVMMTCSCWTAGFLHSMLHTVIISKLKYCENRLVLHFFCDVTPLIKLACSSTTLSELLIYTEASMASIAPFLLVLISYVLIARAIIRLKTTSSRKKAFSSCSSHLMVVCLFYGTIIFIYFRPASSYASPYDRLVSMAYTIMTPMLNPFIYSLRNQEVKQALKRFAVQPFV
ncbi:uncharacterized protein PAF06_010351 [Gastrophryne carolinensis]